MASRKRKQAHDDLAQMQRDFDDLVYYLKDAHPDVEPQYIASLLSAAYKGWNHCHNMVGAVVSTAGAHAFCRAGACLDLCSGPAGITRELFSSAGQQVLEQWYSIKSSGLSDVAMSKRIWEHFEYNNQLSEDANGHRDYHRRVRAPRVRDILQQRPHDIWQKLPELCDLVREIDTALRALGLHMELQDFHLLKQFYGHASFDWHLDKHESNYDVAVSCVLSIQPIDGDGREVVSPLSSGGVLVYTDPDVEGGDQVSTYSYSSRLQFPQVEFPLRVVGDCCLVRGATHYHRTVPSPDGFGVLKCVLFYKEV